MTAQEPENLINEYPRVDFRHLDLYFLSRRDPDGFKQLELPVQPKFPENNGGCTSLWRGYIATFRLTSKGELELVAYNFPYADTPAPTQIVTDGKITGDFWLTLRPFFQGPNTEVPFRNGRIVEDKAEWDIQDQTLRGQVASRFRNSGLIIRLECGDNCFMPRSLIPPNYAHNLDALVGHSVTCEIFKIDDERGNIILRLIAFLDEELDSD